MSLTTTALTATVTGCAVGWKYRYGGQEFTMTKDNSEYHEGAMRDVRKRYGDPEAQTELANLEGACRLLQKYATDAPPPDHFTSARELLDHDARATCVKWHALQNAADARAGAARQQEEHRRREEAREREREAERAEQERTRLESALERDTKMVETCDATQAARDARRRHAEILSKTPGLLVRKQCAPRMELQTVTAQCKDANGFVRPCSKTVSTGEIAGYTCPKTMDVEVVQLGLYQLNLFDSYPYPEDRVGRVRDTDCDEARVRVKQAHEKLDASVNTVVSSP